MKQPRHLVLFSILAFLALGLVFVLGGCQTSKGFGKDVEKLGDSIQKNAD